HGILPVCKWVIVWNSVWFANTFMVDVDPEDFAEQRFQVLTVSKWIVGRPAVSQRYVQVAVRSENDRAPVVIPKRLFDAQDLFFRSRVGAIRIVLEHTETGKNVRELRAFHGVKNEKLTVILVVWVKRQTEKAFFILIIVVGDTTLNVKKHLRLGGLAVVWEDVD